MGSLLVGRISTARVRTQGRRALRRAKSFPEGALDAGMWTVYSCQGFYTSTREYRHLNCSAYIMFRGNDTAQLFADTAARFVGHTITVSHPPRDGFSIARFRADDVQFLSESWEPT